MACSALYLCKQRISGMKPREEHKLVIFNPPVLHRKHATCQLFLQLEPPVLPRATASSYDELCACGRSLPLAPPPTTAVCCPMVLQPRAGTCICTWAVRH